MRCIQNLLTSIILLQLSLTLTSSVAGAPPDDVPLRDELKMVGKLLTDAEDRDSDARLESLNQIYRLLVQELEGEAKADAISRLMKLMMSSDQDVASRACDIISRFDTDAVPLLIDALQSDDKTLQTRAARAISSIASSAKIRSTPSELEKLNVAILPLVKIVEGEVGTSRHNAFYALASLGPEAIPHWIAQLEAEEYFQRVLMRGYLRLSKESIEPLCQALSSGDATTRENAALMLFHISFKAPESLPVLESKGLAALTVAIEDDEFLVRERVIKTLGRMGPRAKPSLGKILNALQHESPPFVDIAEAAEQIGPGITDIPILLEGVRLAEKSPLKVDNRIADNFGDAIAATGKAGLPQIIAALKDPHQNVQRTAMFALSQLGKEAAPALPEIILQLNAGDNLAPQIIGKIGPEASDAVPHLIRRLKHDQWFLPRYILPKHEPEHYSQCGDALVAIGPKSIPALLAGLKDENDLVNAGSLNALLHMEEKSGIPIASLEPLCRDKHSIVQGLAFKTLVACEEKRRVKATLARLKDDAEKHVAEAAEYHLGKFKIDE